MANKRVKTVERDTKVSRIKRRENLKETQKGDKKSSKWFCKKGRGTIYLGHIPHGFFEDEMTAYFNQFGKVISASVARSKKTGKSKGYGFVEFTNEEVAKVAAETMNNYLMYNRVLKCRYIPPEEREGRIFVRKITPTDYPRKRNRKIDARNKINAFQALKVKDHEKKTKKKIKDFKKFFKERGINFNFKVSGSNSKGDGKSTDSSISTDSASEDETDEQFGVLEIDESDNEIYFKTPPQVKKVIKKSVDSPLTMSKAVKKRKVSKKSKKN